MESHLSLIAGGTGLVGSHVIKVLSKKSGTVSYTHLRAHET